MTSPLLEGEYGLAEGAWVVIYEASRHYPEIELDLRTDCIQYKELVVAGDRKLAGLLGFPTEPFQVGSRAMTELIAGIQGHSERKDASAELVASRPGS